MPAVAANPAQSGLLERPVPTLFRWRLRSASNHLAIGRPDGYATLHYDTSRRIFCGAGS